MTMQYNPSVLLNILLSTPPAFRFIRFFAVAPATDCTVADPGPFLAETSSGLSVTPVSAGTYTSLFGIPSHYNLPMTSDAGVTATVTTAGTVQSFRMYPQNPDNGNLCTCQGTVGLAGSGADLILSSVDVAVNDVISISSVSFNVTVS